MSGFHNKAIAGNSDRPIFVDYYPHGNDGENRPLIIFCHGHMGFKDWGHYALLPAAFNEAGFDFLKFNFSHNGCTPDHTEEITDLEAFSGNTLSQEMDDLQAVLDWVTRAGETTAFPAPTDQIYLLGHSRGGSICMLTASFDRRIKKIVTWSTVGNLLKRFPNGKKLTEWKIKGVLYLNDPHQGKRMPHHYHFFEDFQNNREKFDVVKAAGNLTIPHLLIHGTRDETVYLGEAIHLMSQNEHASLIKLRGATHTFGGYHPYLGTTLPPHAEVAVNYTIAFLRNE